ncbi:T9SS type A sorting domain-containing protein [bacterium]|nr:T9SS type A sorting domain-containing protein [bacterium]
MFTKKPLIISISGLLVLGMTILFTARLLQEPPQKPGAATINGQKEDAYGRQQYEFMRTRDPATNEIPQNIKAKAMVFARQQPMAKSAETDLEWTTMGPYNVGGRTRALGVDIRNSDIILAGGVSGAMYRSTDAGASWTNVTHPDALHSITCLVQDIRNGHEDTWYYGTGEGSGNSASADGAYFIGRGIYKSTDNGLTWQPVPVFQQGSIPVFDRPYDMIWNIAIDPSNSSQEEIYLAAFGTLYRSIDDGQSWNVVIGGSKEWSYYTDVDVTSTGIVYSTFSNDDGIQFSPGIWRSTDGINFTDITPAGLPATYDRIVIGIAPSDENTVFFLCATPGHNDLNTMLWRYNYLSGDGTGAGGLWTDLSDNIPDYGDRVGDYNPQGSYNMLVKVKPDDRDVVFIGGTNLYRSTNGFTTKPTRYAAWVGGYPSPNEVGSMPGQHPDQHCLVFLPGEPQKMLSGHDGGVSITSDNLAAKVKWDTLNSGYYTTQFYTIALDGKTPSKRVLFGGLQDHGIYAVSNAGPQAHWALQISGDGAFTAIGDGSAFAYFAYQNGVTFWQTLNAQSLSGGPWTRVDPEGSTVNQFINPTAMDPANNKRIYFAGRDKIWRNGDCTQIPKYSNEKATVGWNTIPGIASEVDTIISAIAVSKTPANIVYFGTSNDASYNAFRCKIFRVDEADSSDATVTDIFTGKGLPNGYVSCLAIHPDNADKVIAVFSNYSVPSVFYSHNGGSSWTDVSANLEENIDGSGAGPSCRWATWLPAGNTDWIFLGTSTGLYSTTMLNGGSTQWSQEGPVAIGNVVVDMVVARPSDGWVVAATHGKGVFATTVVTGVEDSETLQPDKLTLQPNYPNPFNPATTIPFTVDKTRHISIKIYDIRGRLVKTLTDNNYGPGTHRLNFRAENLASGAYLVRLESEGLIKTQKINLIK